MRGCPEKANHQSGMSLVSVLVGLALFGVVLTASVRMMGQVAQIYEYQDIQETRSELLLRYQELLKKKGVRRSTVYNWGNIGLFGWAVNGSGAYKDAAGAAPQDLTVYDAAGNILIPKEGINFDKKGRKTASEHFAFKVKPAWIARDDGNYELSVEVINNPRVIAPFASSKNPAARVLNTSQTECFTYRSTSRVIGPQVSASYKYATRPFTGILPDQQLTVATASCPQGTVLVGALADAGCNASRAFVVRKGQTAECRQQTSKIPEPVNCEHFVRSGTPTPDVYGITCEVKCCRFGT